MTSLQSVQYGSAGNLNARVALHARFRANPYGFHRWVFDRLLTLPFGVRILELGCGPGWLWHTNADRVDPSSPVRSTQTAQTTPTDPAGWAVLLTDVSPGMIREARANLVSLVAPRLAFAVADAQSLPFPDACFDAVIANHVLYHVPDRERAYAEIRRVLRPGGRFFAATNGAGHMRELSEMLTAVLTGPVPDFFPLDFTLESGQPELARWFAGVTIERYPDALVVTKAEPLVAYARSMPWFQSGRVPDAPAALARFQAAAERSIADHGAVRITTDAGLFTATRL